MQNFDLHKLFSAKHAVMLAALTYHILEGFHSIKATGLNDICLLSSSSLYELQYIDI